METKGPSTPDSDVLRAALSRVEVRLENSRRLWLDAVGRGDGRAADRYRMENQRLDSEAARLREALREF